MTIPRGRAIEEIREKGQKHDDEHPCKLSLVVVQKDEDGNRNQPHIREVIRVESFRNEGVRRPTQVRVPIPKCMQSGTPFTADVCDFYITSNHFIAVCQ